MRFPLAILIVAAAPALAGPPSNTLERAVKLYDKQDYLSAHIELQKVVTGESGDDAENVERAEFFVGKTLYQLGYYVVANAAFDRIAQKGAAHRYYLATLKWYTALLDKLPIEPMGLVQYAAKDLADPTLATAKDQLAYHRGVIAIDRSDLAKAAAELATVDRASKLYGKARLALGFVQVRTAKQADALATFAAIPVGDDLGDLAALASGQLQVQAKAWDKAIAAYAKVRATGPLGARAAWESSWAKLDRDKKSAPLAPLVPLGWTPVVAIDGPDPALLPGVLAYDLCAKKPATSSDALAAFRADAAALTKDLAALAAQDDNADFYELIVKLRAGKSGLSKRAQALVRLALDAASVRRAFAFVAELDRELGVLSKVDKAYQTTAAAAEVLQELTVQQAVAQADAGKIARDRVLRLQAELGKLAANAAIKISVGADQLVVRCP